MACEYGGRCGMCSSCRSGEAIDALNSEVVSLRSQLAQCEKERDGLAVECEAYETRLLCFDKVVAERDALKAEVERLRDENDNLRDDHDCFFKHCHAGQVIAEREMQERIAGLEKERDALRVSQNTDWQRMALNHSKTIGLLITERDALKADLAAMTTQKNSWRDAAADAEIERDALKARAEAAEAGLDEWIGRCGDYAGRIAALEKRNAELVGALRAYGRHGSAGAPCSGPCAEWATGERSCTCGLSAVLSHSERAEPEGDVNAR